MNPETAVPEPAPQPAPRPPVPPPPRGIRLGHIARVPIYLHASWLFLAVVVIAWYGPYAIPARADLSAPAGYAIATGFMLVLLLSVLLHELGHLVEAQDGRWLIPDDGNAPGISLQNTALIEAQCRLQILSLSEPTNLIVLN